MASQKQLATGRKKVVHHLETPFSAVSWPEISVEDQDTILELLCNLLGPLGHHRKTHIKQSKGRRAARRRKEVDKLDVAEEAPAPPVPPIATSIDVGFNSITRGLQSRATDAKQEAGDVSRPQYSVIIVARGDQSSAFNCHFPQMVAVACNDDPPETKIRLVGMSKPCSERLSSCLGLPRVSAIAVREDAPEAGALQEFVREVVAPVHVGWLDASQQPSYLATQISSVETPIGNKRVRI